MRIGVGIDPRLGLSRAQQRELVLECARLGYESLWTPANVGGRDALHVCAQWWRDSTEVVPEGLVVGISVVPFPVWSVITLAAQASTIGDLTGGRFILGIGLGGYASETFRERFGLPDVQPVTFSRDYTRAIRALLRGETVDVEGPAMTLRGAKLALSGQPVPVYLGALGPRMLRVAGQVSDGVLPNWSSPEEIANMRRHVNADIPFAQYIRVCVDDDEEAARRAFAANMLGYALARPGQRKDQGYRGHFARMGFDDVLNDLEARLEAGATQAELADRIPNELLLKVGYFGKPDGVAPALQRQAAGLDEAMVRLITTESGSLEKCVQAVRACNPASWRPAA